MGRFQPSDGAAVVGIGGGVMVMAMAGVTRTTTPELMGTVYMLMVIGLLLFFQKPGRLAQLKSDWREGFASAANAEGGSPAHAAIAFWLVALLLLNIHLVFGTRIVSPLVGAVVGIALLGFGLSAGADSDFFPKRSPVRVHVSVGE